MRANLLARFFQKIEVSDDDDELNEDAGIDMMASDIEQMQSLLEFKVHNSTLLIGRLR